MAPLFSYTAGIKSVASAVLFAVLYFPLASLFIWKTARNPAYAYIALVFFCVFRVVGFIMRTILAASDGAKENDGLVIAEMVFFSLGFVGLLYSVFLLILERTVATRQVLGEDEEQTSNFWILDLILSRRITDLTFTAAAGVSIAAAAYIGSNSDEFSRLRKVTIILYLVLTIVLSIHGVSLVCKERKALRLGLRQPVPLRQACTVYMHCPILFLLMIRQAFLLATFDSDKQYDESLWYPLFATPEFLATCLFSTPGLVPRPEELSEDRKRSYWSRLWRAYNTSA